MVGTEEGKGWCERAFPAGSNLEVASVIREYLDRSNGDTRLALAISVADQIALAKATHRQGADAAWTARAPGRV